ncbi:MAG TPA: hypothetical protein ENF16_02535 [Bacteroidetes bacterium]|nr:hypothetical protein [Bacteroidota bacterium]
MSRNFRPPSDYRSQYLHRVCGQNRTLFDSPYVWQFTPDVLPLDPRRYFNNCRRTLLEIGFGHGEVLEEMIPGQPDTGFLGIERRPARVRRAVKRLERIGFSNAALIRINLELCRDRLFVPDAFDQILVNHPDPWPKKRHEHHRFFRPEVLNWLGTILAPGGTIEVASDNAEYFFRILRLFEERAEFESLLPPPFYTADPIPGRPQSRYERKKRRAGEIVRVIRFILKK